MKEKIYPLYLELGEKDYQKLISLKKRLGERTKVGVIRFLLRVYGNDGNIQPTQKLD